MFSFMLLCFMMFGIFQMARYAKNNPGNVLKGASILKQLLGK